jgi:hypothetical protein
MAMGEQRIGGTVRPPSKWAVALFIGSLGFTGTAAVLLAAVLHG